MCGFLAYFSGTPQHDFVARHRRYATNVKHRGNSSQNEWRDAHAELYHYRLAFRDVAQGQQPMQGSGGKGDILVYNGELYHFAELRRELSAHYDFQNRSDTEVLLAALRAFGVQAPLRIDGEFSFVYWNQKKKQLLAGRDPFGVKPLFFAAPGLATLGKNFFRHYKEIYEFSLPGDLSFASELKALPLTKTWCEEGSKRQFLGLYEEMGTAFTNIFQLAPGSIFSATLENGTWNCKIERVETRRRFQPHDQKDFSTRAQLLENALATALINKLDSEVPLGVYLSGGIDSRIVAHELGQKQSSLQSFTVGFADADYDESTQVREFLRAYPAIQPKLLRTDAQALHYAYDHALYASELIQPYTNGSAKWWLSRFARRHVQGVLTGDGSDELFCGYPSYRYLAWWQFYQRRPTKARAQLYRARVEGKAEKFWEKGISSQSDGRDLLESQAMLGWFHPLFGQIKAMAVLWHGSERAALQWLQSVRDSLYSYVNRDIQERASPLTTWQNYFLRTHFATHVLNWVGDRMEMANTLEGRPLYLTREIWKTIEHAPDHALVRGMRDKAVLRAAYTTTLKQFSREPKKQFNAPFLGSPVSGPLLDAEALKRAQKLQAESTSPLQRSYASMFLQNALVSQKLQEYLVEERPPMRDLDYEEDFLNTHTEELT